VIREARQEDAAAIVAAYEWLFALPGLRPPDWDPRLAAERLGRLIEAADAHRFYERERPDYRSIQFGWGL
jgi:hypothetical protein